MTDPSLPPNPGATRYHDLDALRAFAMLLGLVLHGLLSFMPVPFWPGQDIYQNPEVCGAIVALIHGFRMPLFFLLSGFFMMMLWKKRGSSGLIRNRALRILVPLAVGTIIIWPLVLGIGIWGGLKKQEIAKTPGERSQTSLTIWQTAKNGDLEKVRSQLDSGKEVNARDEMGISVLSWASMGGSEEVVALLIDRGVDVNARDREKRVALHGAAFLGRTGVVKQLIEAGAEVNVVGSANDTPIDSALSDRNTLNAIGGWLQLEFDADEVMRQRNEVIEELRSAGGKRGGELDRKGAPGNPAGEILRAAAFAPVFHHLWFLHYLVWFTIAFLILTSIGKAIRLKPLPSLFIRAPFCLIWLIPLTWFGQRMMNENLGPDTAAGILIWPPIFYYYGIFVLFGALCFGREEFMKSNRFGWLIYLLLAAAVGFAAIAEPDLGRYRDVVQPLFGAAFVWLMSFGLIGMFRLLFNGENRKIRWLSDSAYWLYLAHLPLMMAIQIWVSDWEFPLVLKFLFVVLSTTAILLILYHVMIRHSFIGTILNGKKVKPTR